MSGTLETRKFHIGCDMPMIIAGINIKSVGDVTGVHYYTEIEIKRKGDPVVRFTCGMEHKEIDFDIDSDDTAACGKLKSAFGRNKNAIPVSLSDIDDNFIVTKMTKNEPVDDVVTYSVSIRPAAPALVPPLVEPEEIEE
jgi:hypothetical protein